MKIDEPTRQSVAGVEGQETVAELRAEVAALQAELASYRRADATERLQAGYARTMIDEMYQFVALLDVEGRLLEVNLPALTGVGVTRAEVIGRPMPDVHAWQVSKEVNDRVRQSIRDAAEGQFVRYETLLYGGNAGKDVIWIDYSLAPVRDSSGKIVFLLGEGRNITEKKLADVELARKTEELRIAHERLKEFDRLKTEFFANVSHELRTPLALILGPVPRQLEAPGLTSSQRHDLEVVARNAQTLLKHVNDLLDLSKLEAGRMIVHYCDADLAKLVRLIASHFDVLASERKIRYSVEASDQLNAQFDAEKVQRVLLNLLSNAFKFTPPGGQIQVQLNAEDGSGRIQVRDSGPGIPEHLRDVIFERFRQADGTSTRRLGGTGLGLAIVKEFVDLHGGTVGVNEAPGGGAQFAIVLPLQAPPEVEVNKAQQFDEDAAAQTVAELRPVAASAAPQAPVNAPVVLVVEDNLEMNAFVAETLAREYRVVTALDGHEGLAKALASVSPDIIVSDVMMPHMSGDEMVRELRARPELTDVPIIMLTAKADDQLRVKLLANSVQDYIAKPFLAEELLAKATALISQRRRVQEKFQAAQRQISTILDHAPVAVYIKDRSGRMTFVNQEVATILGRPAAELLGKTNHDLLPPELADAVDANDRAALVALQPVQLEELIMRNGQIRTYLSVKFPLSDQRGEIYAICGISTDITEKKHVEDELCRAKQAAEQANKAKDHFLAVVSHELRTPLSPILTATSFLQLHEELPPEVRKSLDIILRNVEQEIRLVDDLLHWTRLARSKLDLHQEAVDAHELVRTALGQFQAEMDSKAIELSIGLRAKNRFIWADHGRIQQVLSNLLANAVKFTPQGGRIAVRTSNIEDGKLRIEVDDSGIGIEPDVLPKLFNAFEQGERTLTRRFGGLGLGLAISKGIVDLHEGRLSAHSAGKDQGATFMLDMNTTPIVPQLLERADANDSSANEGRRLLLVEDHRDTLEVMTSSLTGLGYRVATATNVAEALRLIDREPFDLLVSDIGLGDGSGLDIMRHVKETRHLKGIALSGFGTEEDHRRSKQAGFSEHLTKPIDIQRLTRVIDHVLAD